MGLIDALGNGEEAEHIGYVDFLLLTHFLARGEPYLRTRGICPKNVHDLLKEELDLPHLPDGSCPLDENRFVLEAHHFFKVLLRQGSVPFGVLSSLAGVLDDALVRGDGPVLCTSLEVPAGQTRAKVPKIEVAFALQTFLHDPSQGAHASAFRHAAAVDVPMSDVVQMGENVPDSHPSLHYMEEIASQICGLPQNKVKSFKKLGYVMDQGALALYAYIAIYTFTLTTYTRDNI